LMLECVCAFERVKPARERERGHLSTSEQSPNAPDPELELARGEDSILVD